MAIIVDKIQKRKDIALSCKDLFVQHGINDLTISQVAKTAGVGKGTIYDYFKNKEDIVFEIVNILLQQHDISKREKISNEVSTKNKVKMFFDFFYNQEDIELRQLYKEFVSIALSNVNEDMRVYQTACFENYFIWFENIIKEGVEKKEISEQALKLTKGIFVFGEGVFINSITTHAINDVEEEINQYIDTIFELIEIKDV